jgi:hypothetical protein
LLLALQSPSPDTTRDTAGGDTGKRKGLKPEAHIIYLDANLPREQIVASGTREALQWLATRLQRRLALRDSATTVYASFEDVSGPVELTSAGLD